MDSGQGISKSLKIMYQIMSSVYQGRLGATAFASFGEKKKKRVGESSLELKTLFDKLEAHKRPVTCPR